MKVRKLLFSFCFAVTLFTSTTVVLANPYMPSFVEIVTDRYTRWGYVQWRTTLPVLLGISLIETLVARRYFKEIGSKRLLISIFVINTLTSIAGWQFLPRMSSIWSSLLIAFLAAVILEWGLLTAYFRFLQGALLRSFSASLQMNIVTYILMAAVLAYLIELPTVGTEDKSLPPELRGTLLLLEDLESSMGYTLDLKSGKLSKRHRIQIPHDGERGMMSSFESNCYTISPNGMFKCCMVRGRFILQNLITKSTIYDFEQDYFPNVNFSPDSRYCYASTRKGPVLIDIARNRTIRVDAQLSFFDTVEFSYDNNKLAGFEGDSSIYVLECETGKSLRFNAPGGYRESLSSRDLVWSPGAKHIAYQARHPSKYAIDHENWDIRVITADGKRTATVFRKMPSDLCIIGWVDGAAKKTHDKTINKNVPKSGLDRFREKCASNPAYKELVKLLDEGSNRIPYRPESIIEICWNAGGENEKDAAAIFAVIMGEARTNPFGTTDFLFPPSREKASTMSQELEHAFGINNEKARLYSRYTECYFQLQHTLPK